VHFRHFCRFCTVKLHIPSSARIELNIVKYDLVEKRKARERQGERTDLHPSNFPQMFGESYGEPIKHEAEVDAVIGERAGVSRETVRKYRKVREKATPERGEWQEPE